MYNYTYSFVKHPMILYLIVFLVMIFIISCENTALCSNNNNFDQSAVYDNLKSAVEKLDELEKVPESKWFGTDKEDVNDDLNDILNETISYLDIPEFSELRDRYRKLENIIINNKNKISELREDRLFAPEGESTFRTKYIPTQTMRNWTAKTRGDYDVLINAYEEDINDYQNEMEKIEIKLSELMSDIGIELNPDQLEFWLSSIIGDDVLSMSVVFSNVKVVTNQLAKLTKESGENLGYAKRYYGMLVALHKLVVHMQSNFISKVNNNVLPKLSEFSDEADKNISEAKRLINEGGNRSSLESNIDANQLTKKTIDLYKNMVIDHRNKVNKALSISEREMKVAVNTYKTVSLSSEVIDLIQEGRDTFETLSNLQIPAATEFQNNEIREEFRKLTKRLNKS